VRKVLLLAAAAVVDEGVMDVGTIMVVMSDNSLGPEAEMRSS